jgi:sugar phosphate isomerase/epimerase
MDQLTHRFIPGVIFWAGAQSPAATLAELTALGIHNGQLGIPGDLHLVGAAEAWKQAAQDAQFTIHTVVTAYNEESYADLATVQRTVGFVPQNYRSAREARTHAVIDFAQLLGAPGIATHIGFVPEDSADPEYQAVLELVRRIADHAAPMTFALETGQETAPALLAFLEEANRSNLGINFDPANMILYGTGEPIAALSVLAKHVLSVHAKDGTWPTAPGQLGSETPLGQGSVNIPAFLQKLRDIGYSKPVFIERESSDPQQRLLDIASALKLIGAGI